MTLYALLILFILSVAAFLSVAAGILVRRDPYGQATVFERVVCLFMFPWALLWLLLSAPREVPLWITGWAKTVFWGHS